MKQAILFAVAAFLISMAATTLVLVRSHPPVPIVAQNSTRHAVDSTRADSTPKAGARPDSVPAVAIVPKADSARAHDSVPVSPHADSTPRPIAAPVLPAVAPHPVTPIIPTNPAAKAAAYKQVARVLSAMKPPEAVKVIAYLNDDEVEGLLRALGPRQAADFLTNMSKERAGKLSRRLLVPEPRSDTP